MLSVVESLVSTTLMLSVVESGLYNPSIVVVYLNSTGNNPLLRTHKQKIEQEN